jgi:imidazoleglycerol-phosphate dehydratase
MNGRSAEVTRETRETQIRAAVRLDGPAEAELRTGLGFVDHMLDTFALHGGIGLRVEARGDVAVDPHHLVEDLGLVLGDALARALGGGAGIERAGFFVFPMDRSLAQVAVDLCGRPNLVWNVPLEGGALGGVDPRLFRDFFKALSDSLRATVHVNVPYADGDHHAVEAVFKAFARALRGAVAPRGVETPLSTKGVIDD